MIHSAIGLLKKIRIVLSEAFSSFRRNKGLTAASSLAFLSTLALIPMLLLLTFLLGALIGSSARALEETQELLKQLVPAYSQVILNELSMIMRHKRAIGVINFFVLFWTVTRLVAGMRISLSTIFQKTTGRPFLLEKLFDVAISILFLAGFSVVAIAGVALPLVKRIRAAETAPCRPGRNRPLYRVHGRRVRALLHVLHPCTVSSSRDRLSGHLAPLVRSETGLLFFSYLQPGIRFCLRFVQIAFRGPHVDIPVPGPLSIRRRDCGEHRPGETVFIRSLTSILGSLLLLLTLHFFSALIESGP